VAEEERLSQKEAGADRKAQAGALEASRENQGRGRATSETESGRAESGVFEA